VRRCFGCGAKPELEDGDRVVATEGVIAEKDSRIEPAELDVLRVAGSVFVFRFLFVGDVANGS
jgi:hypothetical protein